MNLYGAAVGLSVLGSFGGVIAASTFLLLGDSIRVKVLPWAISYAVGTLLGVAVLALLPQALERLPAGRALGTLLIGVLAFFLLEKLVLWRHCHDANECEVHTSSAASLGRAFTLNLLSGIGGILGAVGMLMASQSLPNLLPYVLAFAAGNFLYVAMSDLIPDLHRGGLEGGPFRQLLLIGAGVLTIIAL